MATTRGTAGHWAALTTVLGQPKPVAQFLKLSPQGDPR